MKIVGGGLSGLLCGALNPNAVVYEAGPKRESDHKALFRCRTPEIGRILGIPFKEVKVNKAIWDHGKEVNPTPRIAHLYSQKVTGKITGRSILDIRPVTRYIPPEDFVEQLQERCNIEYNTFLVPGEIDYNCPVISTIPLPSLLVGLKMKDDFKSTEFIFRNIHTERIEIDECDSYCTVYYPEEWIGPYRASITGSTLIIESMKEIEADDLKHIFTSLGIPMKMKYYEQLTGHMQKMGKIYQIDEQLRKNLITKLTIKHNIYSLGRFATWRPKVMLDDVLEDIFVIRRLIAGGNYASMNHKQGEK